MEQQYSVFDNISADEIVELARSRGFVSLWHENRRSGWAEALDSGGDLKKFETYATIVVMQMPFYPSDKPTNRILARYWVGDLKRILYLHGETDEYGTPNNDLTKILGILQG